MSNFTRLVAAAALSLLTFSAALAQTGSVGIGTTAPDASAALDIVSGSKGALLPRLTAAARLGIAAPAPGLLVFQTDNPLSGTGADTQAGFWYYNTAGTAPGWQRLADSRTLEYSPSTGLAVGGSPNTPYGGYTTNLSTNTPFHGEALGTRIAYFLSAASLTSAGLSASQPITSLGLMVMTKNSTGPFANFTVQLGTTTNTSSYATDPTEPLTTLFTGSVNYGSGPEYADI